MILYNKKVLKLLRNKNFRNSQNYVIQRENNLKYIFFWWSFKVLDKIYFYRKKSILLKIISFILMKNNYVFYYLPNKYLVLKYSFLKYAKK